MKLILENWRQYLTEAVPAWHGSKVDFDTFDLSRTTEFGFHFGLDEEQSKHRMKNDGILFSVELDYQNPLKLPDVFRWTLESVLIELDVPADKIKEYKIQASKKARESGGSMRVEENNLLGDILSQMGYDAIEYDNKGESGGSAIILWDPDRIKIVKKETI